MENYYIGSLEGHELHEDSYTYTPSLRSFLDFMAKDERFLGQYGSRQTATTAWLSIMAIVVIYFSFYVFLFLLGEGNPTFTVDWTEQTGWQYILSGDFYFDFKLYEGYFYDEFPDSLPGLEEVDGSDLHRLQEEDLRFMR